jgi:hypothetical protein
MLLAHEVVQRLDYSMPGEAMTQPSADDRPLPVQRAFVENCLIEGKGEKSMMQRTLHRREMSMWYAETKRLSNAVIVILVGMLLLGVAIPGVQAGHKAFDNESLEGAYGYTASGTFGATSAVAVARLTFDGDGACTFVQTTNLGASGGPPPLTATACAYSVAADGTGSLTATFPVFGTFHLAFVLVDNARELLMISTDAGVSATALAKKQ